MGKRHDTDKAIRNIMNWAERPEWSEEHRAILEAHLLPVGERLGMGIEDISQTMVDHGYMGMLFGIIFEDFLSRRLPPDNSNVIDDYLKRRGWRESVIGRRYLQQLRDSVLSLYEVVDVAPGQHCDVRDLVRGGDAVRVHEKMGTQNLVRWDKLAARVLKTDDKNIFSGGILPFPLEEADSVLRVLHGSRKAFEKQLKRLAGKQVAADFTAEHDLDTLFLRDAAPAFTTIWLMHTLEQSAAPLPQLVNRDGEALTFVETRFPFLPEQADDIAARLATAPEWEQDAPDGTTWIWFPPPPEGRTDQPSEGLAVETFQGGQRPISGTLEMTPGVLKLTTNSTERAQHGQQALETLLAGLIGPALSKLQTPEQLMAERDARGHTLDHNNARPADDIDPEITAEVIQKMLDQHYRQTLDEAVPMLDNKTPRQCVRSKKGRDKVIDWLKYLENSERHRAAQQGQAPYDFGWMWEKLKLSE